MNQGARPQPGLRRYCGGRPSSAYRSRDNIVALGRPGNAASKVELVDSTGVRKLQYNTSAAAQPAAVVVSRDQLQHMTRAALQATQESAVEAARRAVETSRAAGEQRAARRERWHSRSSSAPPNRRKQEVENDLQLQQKLQQREEVRQLQRQVLALKCTAVREAQIQEKNNKMRSDQAENARLEAAVEEHRQRALQEEEARHQVLCRTRQVAARSLQLQIEARSLQTRQKTQEKQNEAMLASRRDARLQKEAEAEVKRRAAARRHQLQDIRKQAEDVKIRYKQEAVKDAIEEQKAAQVAEEKVRAAEQAAAESAELRRLQDTLHDQQMQRAEQQQRYRAMKQELQQQREHEQVEREWRARLLHDARVRKAREETVLTQREEQVKMRHEKLRQEEEREKREGKMYGQICVMPGADLRPTPQQKKQTARALLAQAQAAREVKAANIAQAAVDRQQQHQLDNKEEDALRTLQADTISHLRDIGIPGHLVKELERKVLKTRPVPPPRPSTSLGPII